MTKVIYVTQEWLEQLQNELKYLKEVKRKEIADKLKEAISFWDLSENSEYEEARNEQAAVEKRIADLESQLKNVEIIKEADEKKKTDRVTIGSIVTIENIETKQKEQYKIVGTMEADILAEPPKISNESIIWKSLLGKKKNDIVKVKAQGGTFEYKIIKIGK